PCSYPSLHPLSFPTRRSSDLTCRSCVRSDESCDVPLRKEVVGVCSVVLNAKVSLGQCAIAGDRAQHSSALGGHRLCAGSAACEPDRKEHTSELQSRFDLVCRL